MAFKNAIIDDRLDKKYSFVDICIRYSNDWYLRQYRKFPFEERIVIDEELDCWFMNCMYFDDPELDYAKLDKSLWVLYYKGEVIKIILDRDFRIKINGTLYDIVWKILSIKNNKILNEKEIIELLRDILKVYGVNGFWTEKEECTIYVREEILEELL
ncbi:hypothetical protein AVANS_1241 [Campylobacter sp. RM5004]|uniref:hypothetical protein n=1 Tax=Campylobacter sp. RM5004 TaxID=1660078 RepID=UPI001EFB1A94|nr:hypothetical protein [Campylobacter sp. RM5004]ULO01860.1 hypothetical protein AVANS_1241 [Campylobacter sp. RM5004]